MRVLLLSTGHPEVDRYPPRGGIQYQIFHLAKHIEEIGHDPLIVKRDLGSDSSGPDFLEEVPSILSDEIISRLVFGFRTRSVIERFNPDVILEYERFSSYFPSKMDYPTVFFTSNYDAMSFYRDYAITRNRLNHVAFPLKQHLEENIMRRANRVIAFNSDIEHYLHSNGINHTSVIPNAIEPEAYSNVGEHPFILFAGRLTDVKGWRILIEAFDLIADEYPDISLRFIGDGEDRESLERQIESRGLGDRIELRGWVSRSELHDNFGKCMMFVLPSMFETFGIVILEAMASGKPVIASNIMGPKNIIQHQHDGLLFESGNHEELATHIEDLLSNPSVRTELGENALETVQNTYSFEEISKRVIEVCNQVSN